MFNDLMHKSAIKKAWNRLNEQEKSLSKMNPISAAIVFANMQTAEAEMMSRFPSALQLNDHADAFRHAYWSALNAKYVGEDLAYLFGTAHEIGSSALPAAMDLLNNSVGIGIGASLGAYLTDQELSNIIYNLTKDGSLRMIENDKLVPSKF